MMMPFTADMQRRVCRAIEQNIEQWIEAVEEIHENATPGNKYRAMHLQRNMMQAKDAIGRIMAQDDDDDQLSGSSTAR